MKDLTQITLTNSNNMTSSQKFMRGFPHPAPLSHLVHIDSLALSAGLQPTNEGHTIAGLTLELPVADQHGNEQSLACDIHPG